MPAGGEQYGAWFDHAAADAACAFIESRLRHTEAEWAGQAFRLSAWQRDCIVRPVFGWKRQDGTRLIRTVYLEVPRKNGKTELAAALAIVALLGDGEFGGQVYSAAVDMDQAKIVFNKAGTMVGMDEELKQSIEVFKTSLFCSELMASFKPLSSSPSTKHGFHPSALIADELHEWPDGDLYQVVHNGMAGRRQPLEILITTAGLRGYGFAWERHQYALAVQAGEIVNPSFLPVIFAADPDDDWTDEATWRKANPNLGVSPKLDFIRQQCEDAQFTPRLENDFKRFHLNIWTEQAQRWLPMQRWKDCSADPGNPDRWRELEDHLAGRECWGGLDLGSTQDTTSLCWAFPPNAEGERWHYLWRFWLPGEGLPDTEKRLRDRAKKEAADYPAWHRSKAILLTNGNVTDYSEIEKEIQRDAERFKIQDLAIDRWNATQVAVNLQNDGLTVAFFGQGFASMSAPAKEFERQVAAALIEHGNHPVAKWQAGNAAILKDPAGNIKPAKDKSTGHIDGVVAAIMAVGRATSGEKPEAPLEVPEDYEVAVA